MTISKKINKKLTILLLVILGSFFNIIYAQTTISLKTNADTYDINDPITLQANIQPEGDEKIIIKGINGLSGFNIIGQSQSQNYQNINGKTSTQVQIIYTLKAQKKGEYNVGPFIIQYGNNEIQSNTLKIKITGEKIFISGNSTLQNQTLSQNTPTLSQNQNTQTNNFGEIKGIKENLTTPLLKYKLIFTIIILLIIIYITYNYITDNLNYNTKKEDIKQRKPYKKPNYKNMIKKIEKKYLDSEKIVFYNKLGEFFRFYIHNEIDKDFQSKTLAEAKNILNKELFNLFQIIYYPKYNIIKDTKENRVNIIKDLLYTCK